MAAIRVILASCLMAVLLVSSNIGQLHAADFSDEATALPFPPDAQELEFTAWSGDISYKSQSPLKSLAAFYVKEMTGRGWTHDESAAKVEDDRIKLLFKHGASKIEVSLRQSSKAVDVDLDCEKLKFNGVDDPATLAAAGIPVAKSALLVQKEFPLPEVAGKVQFTAEGCTFKSPLSLADAFAYFMKLVPSKGFKESRKPILSDSRKYTEFKKGSAQVSVNIFTDAVGSRIILEYKDDSKKTTAAPLPVVASLPFKVGGAESAPTGGTTPAAPSGGTPVDVTGNKGSATVNYNGKQYVLKNVAAFQTKNRVGSTTLVFAAKPIPYNKMQALVIKDSGFSYGDLYEGAGPDHLVVDIGSYLGFNFAIPGIGIGSGIDDAVNEMKVEGGRVVGTLKMPRKEIFKKEPFEFAVTIDAGIITPSTRTAGPADAVAKSDSPVVADSPVPFPDAVGNISKEGSKFRKTYHAEVNLPLAEVTEFYRRELPAQGWKSDDANASGPMRFKNDTLDLVMSLKSQGNKTMVDAVTRDAALAKKEGILPEAGKGRLILGNGGDSAVVFTVGKANHTLKPGQGAKDYKQAVNTSLAPGTYQVGVKPSGQAAQTETIELTEGSAWGIIALPGGGSLAVQLY